MLQSQLFTKTTKEFPKGEISKSTQFLIKAGFVDKLGAGVFTFLPLGLRVLDKIEGIIANEMESVSGQRISMPALIPRKNWQQTGRWDNFDALFRLKGNGKMEYGLGATHEEVVVPLIKKYVSSYKDLPLAVFQIQDKFRDELRVKSGLLRTREFLMKDLYSFHASERDLESYYEKVKKAYLRIFKKLKITDKTYLTLALGGTFSKHSHEFQAVTSAGEDIIYVCSKCKVGLNRELVKGKARCWQCGKALSEKTKAIEVANIFKLKDKYTKPFDFRFTDRNGQKKLVVMGCYGIGLPRLMGAVVEIFHDKKGIIWPESIAPYKFHLVPVGESREVKKTADNIYKSLQKAEQEVIYDDRQERSVGEKFADCDLIGVPYRLVVSEKSLEKGCLEVKRRDKEGVKLVKIKNLSQLLK
jgi:prolyl-tRNA synthetase